MVLGVGKALKGFGKALSKKKTKEFLKKIRSKKK